MKTVFFFGAGSTRFLNLPLTNEQIDLFKEIPNSNTHYQSLNKLYKIIIKLFGDKFDLQDIYNVIDTNIALNTSLSAEHIDEFTLNIHELRKAREELLLYLYDEFRIIIKSRDNIKYNKLVHFYEELAKNELLKKDILIFQKERTLLQIIQ